ncbi:protease inhibitor I42 family protein, partial [Candidatus Bipolaricaulota bacterium]|nr:protease inhibitor I42 family protein [Candidatus Bipolaricaulota bacterium]
LHRTVDEVSLRGSRTVGTSGSQTSYSLNPGLAFLELPLEEDASWLLRTTGGAGKAQVYHREVAAIESGTVSTLLGTYSPIFVGAWRVHYDLPESSPRLYGGPIQFLWFANGVGVVKHVLNSVDYELAEFRLPGEILALDESDDGRTARVPDGGLVVVQLREGEGWEWVLAGVDGSGLEVLSDEFYADTPRVFKDARGTHSFQLRAMDAGESFVWFELRNLESNEVGNRIEYTIRVN